MKKNSSIWIEPWVQKELRLLSVDQGKPVGEIIEKLLRFWKEANLAVNLDRYLAKLFADCE